jgi:hypothetical protein
MSWTLVVLQTVAIYSSHTSTNWTNLGNYKNEQACIEASRQLVKAQQRSTATYSPNTFACLNEGHNK